MDKNEINSTYYKKVDTPYAINSMPYIFEPIFGPNIVRVTAGNTLNTPPIVVKARQH